MDGPVGLGTARERLGRFIIAKPDPLVEAIREMALDGRGMVPVGFRTSRLSKAHMADLLTFIDEYGARHGVQWSHPE